MRRLVLAVSLFTILFVVSHTSAQQANNSTVPNLIRYSGTVLQPRSVAVSSPIVGVTFAIYKQQEGGAPVWLETQNVTPDATGHYSVLLGSTTAAGLPSDLFSLQEERWLGVQVQGQPEQSRVLLVSVPYAMKAAEADRLAGHSASEFVTTDNLQTAVQQQLQQQTPKGATSVIATGTTTNNGVTPIVTNPATNFVDNTTNQVVQVQQNGTGMGLTASSPSNVAILGTLNYIAKPGSGRGSGRDFCGERRLWNVRLFGSGVGRGRYSRTVGQPERHRVAGLADWHGRHCDQCDFERHQRQSDRLSGEGHGAERHRCIDLERC